MPLALLAGFAFGFLGSMPVAGPVSFLVLRLGLGRHARRAWHVAAGAALAESLYALLAFWGLGTLLDRHPRILPAARILGAVLCLGLGLALLLHRPKDPRPASPDGPPRGRKRSFVAGFLITALNPTFILTWTAALAALNASGLVSLDPSRALPFAVAVFLGIVAWFSTLLWMVARFQARWSREGVAWFIKAMGALLVAGALWMGLRPWAP